MYNQLKSAFITLTRLPFVKIDDDDFNLKDSLWAFPLVGLGLGLILSAFIWVFGLMGVDGLIGSSIVVLALVLLTGGLHEDGLADSVDALGASSTARRLEIMRDSQIGTYGTLALIFSVIIRAYAIGAFWETDFLYEAIIVSLMASRGALVFIPIFSMPARDNGLAAVFKNIEQKQMIISQLIIAIVGFVLMGSDVVFLMMAAILIAFLVAKFAAAKLGGFTGDVLGATEQLVQLTCLVIFGLLY